MSRIGKKPISVPQGVDVKISPGCVEVKGPLGSVKQNFPTSIDVKFDAAQRILQVSRPNDQKRSKAFQGLSRALIANAVKGVTVGFEKGFTIVGTGYNAKLKGKHLELQVGYCLPQALMIPDGLKVEVPAPTKIIVKGCDRHLVGQFAANIRRVRPPDPYKGKGIRYVDEVVKTKERKGAGTKG